LLLPLALSREYGIRTACFMGGKHSTFNMALWDRNFATEATAVDLKALIAAIRERSSADVLALAQQPLRWRDVPNPFAGLPHQESVNDCPLLAMVPDAPPTARISHSFRRRLKAKERKLQNLPGYRYGVTTSDAEIKRLLDWFFVEEFVRTACMAKLAGGGHIIDIHALECDDEVIAIFAGVADGHRFSMMFNTYTMSANARYSPGLILMRDIVDHYAGRGYRAIDFGIGSDDYKRFFCKNDEPIFDCFIPLSLRGQLAASAMSGINRAKYLVKHNQALLQIAQKLRSAFRR
jgi:CelD/BcsL family acetyltransferase involved in cellulose biosynthesis